MDHNDIRHKLSDYLDDSMNADEKAEIEKHLASCEQCGAALRELRKTIEHIKTVEEVEPPAWMTRKIMANVRAAAEEEKSWLKRFFFPLSVKLPLQTVTVLFLAMTTYYIYQTMQPTARYNEATSEPFSQEKKTLAPPPVKSPMPARQQSVQDKAVQGDTSSITAAQVPQTPQYKALDMKQEYEKPAPPEPAGQHMQEGIRALGMGKQAETASAHTPDMAQKQSAAADALQTEQARETLQPSRKTKTALSAGARPACLSYEPVIVELTGIIKSVAFPGPPNYDTNRKSGKQEVYWILTLDKEICVSAGLDNRINEPEDRIAEVQLVLSPENYEKYRPLLAKPVTITGALFHATTEYHHTPVLLKMDRITLSAHDEKK